MATTNDKVVEAVAAGETFVVTRNGTPVNELRPVGANRLPVYTRNPVSDGRMSSP